MNLPVTSFSSQTAGQIAVAIAVAFIVGIVTLGLLYSGLPVFGPINDITNAVVGLLSALLAWQLHTLLRERVPGATPFYLLAAWAGAAAIIINSLMVAFGQMGWKTGGMYTAIGYALIGIWLLALQRLIGPQPFLTPGIMRLGTLAAIAMLFGLLAGPMLASGVNFTKNPLVSIAYLGAASGWLLYPIWCWMVGRGLLNS